MYNGMTIQTQNITFFNFFFHQINSIRMSESFRNIKFFFFWVSMVKTQRSNIRIATHFAHLLPNVFTKFHFHFKLVLSVFLSTFISNLFSNLRFSLSIRLGFTARTIWFIIINAFNPLLIKSRYRFSGVTSTTYFRTNVFYFIHWGCFNNKYTPKNLTL